jgi:hypothetical protein
VSAHPWGKYRPNHARPPSAAADSLRRQRRRQFEKGPGRSERSETRASWGTERRIHRLGKATRSVENRSVSEPPISAFVQWATGNAVRCPSHQRGWGDGNVQGRKEHPTRGLGVGQEPSKGRLSRHDHGTRRQDGGDTEQRRRAPRRSHRAIIVRPFSVIASLTTPSVRSPDFTTLASRSRVRRGSIRRATRS